MASIEKRGNRWLVRWYDPSGKRRAKRFDRKTDAQRFSKSVETDMLRGQYFDPARGKKPFDKWAKEVMDARVHLRPSGLQRDLSHLKNHILPAFGRTPLSAITRSDVRAWVRELSEDKGLAPRTVRDCYRILASIMGEALDEKLIAESPCRKIKLPRIPEAEKRFLNHEEVVRLAQAIDPRYEAMVYVGAYLGLRWAEAAGVKVKYLDLARGRVLIAGSLERVENYFRYVEETKTAASRRLLDLPEPLIRILTEHLDRRPDSEFVFPAPEGGVLNYHSFMGRFWRPAIVAAGLEPLTFHELRHTCVALLVDQGADIFYVQRFLGHKDIRTTFNIYGHLFPQRGRETADAMGRALDEALRRFEDGHED